MNNIETTDRQKVSRAISPTVRRDENSIDEKLLNKKSNLGRTFKRVSGWCELIRLLCEWTYESLFEYFKKNDSPTLREVSLCTQDTTRGSITNTSTEVATR